MTHDEVIEIPIAEINIANPRHRDKLVFDKIVNNIDQVGLKRPITVSKRESYSDGPRYDLVCGQGRIEALLALGETTVPAIIVDAPREEQFLMSLVENIARRPPGEHDIVREIRALRKVLRDESFDVCVDMQGAIKSAAVGLMAEAKVFAGMAAPREKLARRFYDKMFETHAAHVVEQGCELLGAAVGELLTPARVTLPMDSEAERWADGVVRNEPFCLITPGAGWGAKVWPGERYGQVASELGRQGVRTVVNGSVHGSKEAVDVVNASDGFARAVPCSIKQLIALVRRATLVIGGDTGPLHMAAALERPVVGIFGPTDPARNGPYGTRSRVLRDAESITSHKRRHETEAGMLRITVDEVLEAAREMLM